MLSPTPRVTMKDQKRLIHLPSFRFSVTGISAIVTEPSSRSNQPFLQQTHISIISVEACTIWHHYRGYRKAEKTGGIWLVAGSLFSEQRAVP